MAYVPERGDVIWVTLHPQAGQEQSGRRPALVLSPASYNGKVGLVLLCPITSQVKGYPFEVLIPAGMDIAGAILADQIRAVDWGARSAEFVCTMTGPVVAEVLRKLDVLLKG